MTLAFLSTISLIVGIVVAVAVLGFLLFIASYVKAAPDTALIISGFGKRKIIIGGAGFFHIAEPVGPGIIGGQMGQNRLLHISQYPGPLRPEDCPALRDGPAGGGSA